MKPQLLYQKNPNIYKDIPQSVICMPKLDGIRCLTTDKGPVTRSLKKIPNKYINKLLSNLPPGLDGELIVGPPHASDVYRHTNSHVMSYDAEDFDFTYYVFDRWNLEKPYYTRMLTTQEVEHPYVTALKGETFHNNPKGIEEYEELCLETGYEGIIIRSLEGKYKYGRTTLKEANAFKLKRFADSEALVFGMEAEYANQNKPTLNALGFIERSTKKEGLLAKTRMGNLWCRDLYSQVEFKVGTGFTEEERAWWFNNWFGQHIIKYKYFPVGVKDKPRHPVYIGIRNSNDYS